jgi:hypothetical protein
LEKKEDELRGKDEISSEAVMEKPEVMGKGNEIIE